MTVVVGTPSAAGTPAAVATADHAPRQPAVPVHLLGVRGSTPCPGAEYLSVGGHTSCVAVGRAVSATPAETTAAGPRWLVLDAGTGFRDLGPLLGGAALDADVVLTHLHWDHVQGLPFLPEADRPDARVDLWVPVPAGTPAGPRADGVARRALMRSLSPPSFPIGPDGLRGRWRVRALLPGGASPAGVRTCAVPHKGGPTVAVRADVGGRSLAYVPDRAPRAATAAQLTELVRLVGAVDVLLHGAPFTEAERDRADAYGHSTVADAVELAARAGSHRLVLVHHSPARTDDAVAAVEAEALAVRDRLAPGLPVSIGRQGDRS